MSELGTSHLDPRRGQLATPADLIDVPAVVASYYVTSPDPAQATQRVQFGTSGHRGSSRTATFNEDHVAAMAQAVVDYRRSNSIAGPLFLGRDPHAVSWPAMITCLEVFAANDVATLVDARGGYTPTPALSHAIIRHNTSGAAAQADGVVLTPSHNPPGDGGFKYNPPHGGPAGAEVTQVIQDRANQLLDNGLREVRRVIAARALAAEATGTYDYVQAYVDDLPSVIDIDLIRASGVRIGADPMGGASIDFWVAIAERHGLDLQVINREADPTWRFMPLDWDGSIRMDCSSRYAMARLVEQRHDFDVATGNDADADRHGIVTPDAGLMNPNHYLAVAIDYLLDHRPGWSGGAAIGKTVVSTSMIDRIAQGRGRPLLETPVGFKWFVEGLMSGEVAFGGEESAGASFQRRDGSAWTTDKDGILLCLLASEIIAATSESPSVYYRQLTERYGNPAFDRVDARATVAEKAAIARLSVSDIRAKEVAGDPITQVLTHAPGNGAAIGGVKVVTANGWFAARPSGTEDVYKIYSESFLGPEHLARIQEEARSVVAQAIS